ncbi:MAG: hypothetical protein ACI9N9_001341 [Enterobacterales bacterium]|jgi:hypothetical protein
MWNSLVVRGPITSHMNIVAHGKTVTAMQGHGIHLSNDEIAAVVFYLHYTFGNNKGDLVQPDVITEGNN